MSSAARAEAKKKWLAFSAAALYVGRPMNEAGQAMETQSNSTERLLREIEQYLMDSGEWPAAFGRRATGNSELVDRLRSGKTVTLATADKVRAYIKQRRELWGDKV